MSQMEKMLAAIKLAKADIRLAELEKILIHFGYIKVRQSGSHSYWRKDDSPFVTIPAHSGKVRIVYVKEIIKLLGI